MDKREGKFILWFDEVGKDDVHLVGGKNANLGEMYQNLTKAESKLFPGEKISVPYGFAVTAECYRHFIKENNLDEKIRAALKDLNTHDIKQLEEAGLKVRGLILDASFPEGLEKEIRAAFEELGKKLKLSPAELDVAVRS